jgi:hypothetical protein
LTTGDPKRNYKIDDSTNANSNILLTQYSSEASQLIKSFTKNISFVVIILAVIAAMTILDLAMDLGLTRILSDETIDTMIIVVSILLIVFIIFTVRPVLRSQKILDKWSKLFENNAIKTSILLSINNKSREEVLNALSETVEEIDIPLHQYLLKSKQHTEFYNISIDDTSNTNFDILIDKSTINPAIDSSLKNTIQDYGSILVKIIEKTIDKNTTHTFIESLKKYRMKKGNKIGLAILVGESIEQECYELINKIKDKNIRENLILIEKPDKPDLDLHTLRNV